MSMAPSFDIQVPAFDSSRWWLKNEKFFSRSVFLSRDSTVEPGARAGDERCF